MGITQIGDVGSPRVHGISGDSDSLANAGPLAAHGTHPAGSGRSASRLEVPADVVADASRRLELACVAVAGLSCASGSYVVWWWQDFPGVLDFEALRNDIWLRCALVVLSVGLFILSRSGRLEAKTLVRLGLVYEFIFVQAFGSLGDATYFGPRLTHAIVVFFPILVPATPRTTFLVAFAACLRWSMVQELAALHFTEPLVSGLILNGLAAFMASTQSAAICWLGRELVRARRLGSYVLEEAVAAGDRCEVFRARHGMLARPATIKLIRRDKLGHCDSEVDENLRHLEDVACALATLRSPHTELLYDFGLADDGTFYLATDCVEGCDLETLVRRCGPVPSGRVVHLLRQVCESLEEAHAAGIVHGNLEPGCVYACKVGGETDFVKVLDYGLAVPPGDKALARQDDVRAVGHLGYWLLTGRAHVPESTADDPPAGVVVPADLSRLLGATCRGDGDSPWSAAELTCALASCPPDDSWTARQAQAWWTEHAPEIALQAAVGRAAGDMA
jgi:eukaryotic-like serine/threonine-protein kinase